MDPTATDAPAPEAPAKLSLRDRLKAAKEQKAGTLPTILPSSGLSANYPAFLSHDRVMAASKLAGKNREKIGPILVAQTCLVEGERLTVDELTSLLENADAVHLINLVLGDDDKDEGGSGN